MVGGEELERGGAPWLVALARGRKPHCGAALISGIHLLTAAHCIDGYVSFAFKAFVHVFEIDRCYLSFRKSFDAIYIQVC